MSATREIWSVVDIVMDVIVFSGSLEECQAWQHDMRVVMSTCLMPGPTVPSE
jgi:hypothetical protein